MKIAETTSYLLAEVANKYRAEFEKVMTEIGLHGGQVFVLQLLFINNGQSQVELASKLNISPPTINNMVKSLMNNSFVACEKCALDGRVMRVYISEKSKRLENEIKEKWLKFEEDFFISLTATEKLVLFQLLEKLKVVV